MTNQEIFDAVVLHARTQKCKSAALYGCLYRGPNNTKCFAGIFIPDNKYNYLLEPHDAEFVNNKGCFCVVFDKSNMKLLLDLQHIHDYIIVERWENCLKELAYLYELKYTEPTND